MSLVLMPPKIVIPAANWWDSSAIFAFDASKGTANNQPIASTDDISVIPSSQVQPSAASSVIYSTTQKRNSTCSIRLDSGHVLRMLRPSPQLIGTYSVMSWDVIYRMNTDASEFYMAMYITHNTLLDRFSIGAPGLTGSTSMYIWNNQANPRVAIGNAFVRNTTQWARWSVVKISNNWYCFKNGLYVGSGNWAPQSYTQSHENFQQTVGGSVYVDRYQMVPAVIPFDYMWTDFLYNTPIYNLNQNEMSREVVDVSISPIHTKLVFEIELVQYDNPAQQITFGLRHTSLSGQNIRYVANGSIEVNSSGVGTYTPWAVNDKLKMEVTSTKVDFFHNNTLIYTNNSATWDNGTYRLHIQLGGVDSSNAIKLLKAHNV